VKGYLVDTNIPSEQTRETPDVRVAAFRRNAGKEAGPGEPAQAEAWPTAEAG
jgi:hypothetical protein